MNFSTIFGRLKCCRFLALGILALQLLLIISSSNISSVSAQCGVKCSANTTCVRRAQSCLALTCDLYPEFYKSPGIKIGISDNGNPFLDTHTVGIINKTRTLTVRSLNSTDIGRGIYYSIDEEKDTPYRCYFNIFVYDRDQYDGSITVENTTSSIKLNKTFGVIVKSFEEKLSFNFSYEALPLNRLKYNDQVLTDKQVSPCSPTSSWLSCLQSNNLEVKLEKCKNIYPLRVDYEYDFSDEYASVPDSAMSRPHQHFIELFYPPQMTNDSVELEFNNVTAMFKLDCGVACGHPENFVYSWIRTSDPDTILHRGPEYEFSVQSLVSEPLMDKDTIEVACKVTNTINQNEAPNTAGSRTLFKLKYSNQTEELTTSTLETSSTEDSNSTTTTSPKLDLTKAPKGLSGGAIAGIVVGSVAALILIAALILLLARRGSRSSKQESAPTPRRADTANRRDVISPQLNKDLQPNPLYRMEMNPPAAAAAAATSSSSYQQNRQRSLNLNESVISKEGVYYF